MPGSDSDERWRRQFEIFHRALEKEPGERSAFVEGACGDDPELRRKVEALLESHAQGSPLDASVGAAAEALEEETRTLMGREPEGSLRPGSVLADRFEISGVVGRGGMGTVYEARDRRLGTTLALKLLRDEIAGSHKARARFLREINLARKVTHPNACRVYDLVEDGERVFLTMELLEGETLSERLKRSGRLSLEEAGPIVEQVASALGAAHAVGVVHRDLKPSNVMLVRGSGGVRAVVTDFGLATTQGPPSSLDPNLTRSGQILGTPAYMAPEQLEGGEATAATDVYALGLILYEMVTGRQAFEGETPFSVASKRLQGEAPSPRAQLPGLDERWEAAILRCLARHPADRFQSAMELAEALREDAPAPVSIGSSEPPVGLLRRFRLGTLGAAAVGAVVALTAVGWLVIRGPVSDAPSVRSLPFEERDWVLIAGFENRTGEEIFDGTAEAALGRELANSSFVNVVPRPRIADALRLMRKPPETRIDAAIGREVCLRDGEIRSLVTGRIEKLGAGYLVSSELVDPADGVVVASLSEEAAGRDAVLEAVRRLSGQVREALGEELSGIERSAEGLLKVTTPSLRALQLYTQGIAAISPRGSDVAEVLLRQAVVEDPDFASAWMKLAYAIRNQGRPPEDYMPHAERAMELAGGATERERYFIRGSYFWMAGDWPKAKASYEALLRLDPDHHLANKNMALSLRTQEGPSAALPFVLRRAELQPQSFLWNAFAARALVDSDRLPEARPYLERASALISEQDDVSSILQAAWIRLWPSQEAWLRDDVEASERELDRWARTLVSRDGVSRSVFAGHVAHGYAALGQTKKSLEIRGNYQQQILRPLFEGTAAFRRADLAGVREQLTRSYVGVGSVQTHLIEPPRIIRLAQAGLVSEARDGLAVFEAAYPKSATMPAIRGEIALAEGRTEEGIALLQRSLGRQRELGQFTAYGVATSLADAWVPQGKLEEALEVLEDASRRRISTFPYYRETWFGVQVRLLGIYRLLGREAEAQEVEAELRRLTARADPDHWVLCELDDLRDRCTASTHSPWWRG